MIRLIVRRPSPTLLAILLLAAAPIPAAPRAGQAQSPGIRLVAIDSLTVRPVFQELWDESVRANRELVACLGGQLRGDTFKITRAVPLDSLVSVPQSPEAGSEIGSDSVSVGSYLTRLSIETCRPPEWVGTIHTHSSRVEDLRFPKLSPYDRTVVSRWHERWRHDSVFCVLYEEGRPPYCEFREGA